MQTFLPFPSFVESAQVLDNQRLGKQRVETMQIYNSLHNPYYGWKNHPAVKQWATYDRALILYGIAICKEWQARGFKDTLLKAFKLMLQAYPIYIPPPWLGNPAYHSSHRAALLFKNPAHYQKFDWTEEPKLDYIWPI